MFTLIKREIEDHVVYFLGAFVISVIFSALIIAATYEKENEVVMIGVGIVLAVITIGGICGLGVSQMYVDRGRKISAFLSILPVTRGRIFAARVLAGAIVLLILLVPPMVTLETVIGSFRQEMVIYRYYTAEIFSMLFLTGFGIYSTGLMGGLRRSRTAIPTLGSLVLSGVLLTLIVVKGFGIEASMIMFLYAAAGLFYCWRRFVTDALI